MVSILIKEMEDFANVHQIPIMLPDGISFLENYIKKHHVKRILELGTAIGYSAIRMALMSDDIQVVSIERDQSRYEEAIKNVKKAGLENRIKVWNMDIMDYQTEEEFDLIFIDAAKSQYIKFFEKFESNVVDGGTVISDNLNFHGLVKQDLKIENRRLRQLVAKIKNYVEYLKKKSNFKTIFLDIGDGIGVSTKL